MVFVRWSQKETSEEFRDAVLNFAKVITPDQWASELVKMAQRKNLVAFHYTHNGDLFTLYDPRRKEGALVGSSGTSIDAKRKEVADWLAYNSFSRPHVKVKVLEKRNVDFPVEDGEVLDVKGAERLFLDFFDLVLDIPARIERESWPGRGKRWDVKIDWYGYQSRRTALLDFVEENGAYTADWKVLRLQITACESPRCRPSTDATCVVSAKDTKDLVENVRGLLSRLQAGAGGGIIPVDVITEKTFPGTIGEVLLENAERPSSMIFRSIATVFYYKTSGAVYARVKFVRGKMLGATHEKETCCVRHKRKRLHSFTANMVALFVDFPHLIKRRMEFSEKFLTLKGLPKVSGFLCDFDPDFEAALLWDAGSVLATPVGLFWSCGQHPRVEWFIENFKRKLETISPQSFEDYESLPTREKLERLHRAYLASVLAGYATDLGF